MRLAIGVLLIVVFVGLWGHDNNAGIGFAKSAESAVDVAPLPPFFLRSHPELAEIFKDRPLIDLGYAPDINLLYYWFDVAGEDGPALIDRVRDRLRTVDWEIVNDHSDGEARGLEYIRVDYPLYRETFLESFYHSIEVGKILHCNDKVLFGELRLYEWWKPSSDHGKVAERVIREYLAPPWEQ